MYKKNKFLICLFILMIPLACFGLTCDTVSFRIPMSNHTRLNGYFITSSSKEFLQKKFLFVVVPSSQRKWQDYEFFTRLLVEHGFSLFVFDNREELLKPTDESKVSCYVQDTVKTNCSFYDVASDAVIAFRFLKSHNEFRKYKIGFIGHSEGAMAALVASCSTKPDFLVEIASSLMRGTEFVYSQNAFLSPGKFELLKQLFELSEKELSSLSHYAEEKLSLDSLDYDGYLKAVLTNSIFANKKRKKLEILEYYVKAQWGLHNKHDLAMLKFNPVEFYKKIKCPVLYIVCKRDETTYALRDITTLEKTMYKEKKPFYTAIINTTHSFCKYPVYSPYQTIYSFKHNGKNSRELEKVSQMVNLITSWINKTN